MNQDLIFHRRNHTAAFEKSTSPESHTSRLRVTHSPNSASSSDQDLNDLSFAGSDTEPEEYSSDIDYIPAFESGSEHDIVVNLSPSPKTADSPRISEDKGISETALEQLEQLVTRPDQQISDSDKLSSPPGLCVELLAHQRLGYSWMCKMERSSQRGGILADDMGLGKTIQTMYVFISCAISQLHFSVSII